MTKPANKLSFDKVRQIIELKLIGIPVCRIAKTIGCSDYTVTTWVKKSGCSLAWVQEQEDAYLKEETTNNEREGRGVDLCIRCKMEKPFSEFGAAADRKNGRREVCLACQREEKNAKYEANKDVITARIRKSRKEDPARFREYDLKKRFKMTLEDFDALFASQGYKCAACGGTDSGEEPPRTWHIDHDHACCPTRRRTCGNCVRGILCRWCNMALGNAADDPDRLRRLANYVEEHRLTSVSGGD